MFNTFYQKNQLLNVSPIIYKSYQKKTLCYEFYPILISNSNYRLYHLTMLTNKSSPIEFNGAYSKVSGVGISDLSFPRHPLVLSIDNAEQVPRTVLNV